MFFLRFFFTIHYHTAAFFTCTSCCREIGPLSVNMNDKENIEKVACPVCHGSVPLKLNTDKSVYRNYQRATVQESPNSVPPGRLPRSRDVIFLDDLTDCARPGDEIV